MRALLWKELRELAPWFAIPVLLLVLDVARRDSLDWSLRPWEGPFVPLMSGMLVGAALGYAQFRSELRRRTLTGLLHRDSGSVHAVLAKASAALVVLGAVAWVTGARAVMTEMSWVGDAPSVFAGMIAVTAIASAAYGMGALAATLLGRLTTRLLLLGGAVFLTTLACRARYGEGWSALADASLAESAAVAACAGVLVALAGFRLVRAEDAERHPGGCETALCATACGAVLVLLAGTPVNLAERAVNIARMGGLGVVAEIGLRYDRSEWRWGGEPFELAVEPPPDSWPELRFPTMLRFGLVLDRDTGSYREIGPLRGMARMLVPAWRKNLLVRWPALRDRSQLAYLDRESGVVRVFDIWRLPLSAEQRDLPGDVETRLRPGSGRFSADAVVAGAEIREPSSGRSWKLKPDFPRELVEVTGARDASRDLPASVLRDAPAPLGLGWRVGTEATGWSLSVLDPETNSVLLRWSLKDRLARAPWLASFLLLLRGPGVGAISFLSDRNPSERVSMSLLESEHFGRRHPGYLLAELVVAGICAALARRRLRRSGASRARTTAWMVGVVVVGPLLYPVLQLLEPGSGAAPRPLRCSAAGSRAALAT